MRFLITLTAFVAVFVLIGCGGSKEVAQTSDVPDWFTTVPQDPNYLFAAQTAVSQDLQLSIDKAATGARTEIGRQMEIKINGLQKKFEEEVGTGDNAQILSQFTQASKTVVSTTLTGSRVKYQKQVKEGNNWRTYILMEYPIGAANQALMESIKKNTEMYTRFRSTEAFKELDSEVNKYEDFKKQQQPKP